VSPAGLDGEWSKRVAIPAIGLNGEIQFGGSTPN